jgi:uncharacterized protein YjbI with pentapeptide repeats
VQVNGQGVQIQAKLVGTNFSKASFPAAKLTGFDLSGTNLSGANFRGADLRNADLSQVNLNRADLRAANLQGANLDETDLSGANLVGANLSNTSLINVIMRSARLVSRTPVSFPADLKFGDFLSYLFNRDCSNGLFLVADPDTRRVEEVPVNVSRDLGRAFYDSGDWRNAALYICSADLSRTTLSGTRAREANIAGISLRGADLTSADFSDLVFEETISVGGLPYLLQADLTGVKYDNFTIWPPGFTPPPPAR